VGDANALPPSLQLTSVELLEATILVELVVLVMVVEVQLAYLIETLRKLAPGTLPLRIALLPARSPDNGTGAHVESSAVAG
jgi:hypothetical protein